MTTFAQGRAQTGVEPPGLSVTTARRMIAARPRAFSLMRSQGMNPATNPPTLQMRNSAGQMGPAVSRPAEQSLMRSQGLNPQMVAQAGPGQAQSMLRSEGINPAALRAGNIAGAMQTVPGGAPLSLPPPPGFQPTQPTDFGAIREQISAFGPAPTMDDQTMARIRAQEDIRLRNLYQGQLNQLGAAAASSGALFGGDVRQLAAGLAAQRGQQMTEYDLGLAEQQLAQQREDYYKQFGLAGSLALQREQQAFGREERIGGQEFQSVEAQKQRAFAGDQNAQDRLAQMTLAEKNIQASMAELQTQIQAAAAQGDLNRANALQLQANDLKQQYDQMSQQNDQFLQTIGLNRDQFEEGSRQFDLTRGDQVGQWAQELDLRNRQLEQSGGQFDRQLAQTLNLAQMDDTTRRYVAELGDRLQRDLQDDPTALQTALSTLGTVASIPGLGERIFGALFGGRNRPGGPMTQEDLLQQALGGAPNPFAPAAPAAAGTAGMSAFATAGAAAAGVTAAGLLIKKAIETPGPSFWDAGAGQFMAGPFGAVWGAFKGFGPSQERKSQAEFTAQFDRAYQQIEPSLNLPPSDPKSHWNPENRLAAVASFRDAFQAASEMGTSKKVEISEPDMQRMQRLGLVANVQGTDRARGYLIDDPRVIAILGKGDPSQYVDFVFDYKNDDGMWQVAKGGIAHLMTDPARFKVIDKKTGQPIDFNNQAQLQEIATRNLGAS